VESFDSRGVRRTSGISADGGVLRIWRSHPASTSASRRSCGPTRSRQLAQTPEDWQDDLKVTYRRRDQLSCPKNRGAFLRIGTRRCSCTSGDGGR